MCFACIVRRERKLTLQIPLTELLDLIIEQRVVSLMTSYEHHARFPLETKKLRIINGENCETRFSRAHTNYARYTIPTVEGIALKFTDLIWLMESTLRH